MKKTDEGSWQDTYIMLLEDWYINKKRHILESTDKHELEDKIDELDNERAMYFMKYERYIHSEVMEKKKDMMLLGYTFLLGVGIMLIPLYLVLSNM